MKPIEWMNKVLERHGLHKPDGRPLYQYRISDTEFNDLTALLKTSSLLGLENVSRRLLMWDAVMVIYASEWWRRQYSGKWGWEGVFSSVDFNIDQVSTAERNRFVEIGLQRWNRKVRSIGGARRFLGTIATEGGLPLNQLAETGGWLKIILAPVVKKHLNRGLSVHVLLDAYQDFIPSSYRHDGMKQILEDIVHTIVEIREEHRLEDRENPIQWLDEHSPLWREKFPLPIDDDSGKSLLSELIDAAAKVGTASDQSAETLFQLERFLKNNQGSIILSCRLDLPDCIPIQMLQKLDKDILPGRIDLEVVTDEGDVWPWCKGIRTVIKGVDSYKFNGRSFELTSLDVLKGFKVRAKSLGDTVFEFAVHFGERIEQDSAWLFKIINERYEYFGSDSQSIRENEAIVYLPKNFSFELGFEDSKFEYKQDFLEGGLYYLQGKVVCKLGPEAYVLETNTEESAFSYEFIGKTFKGASNPSEIYLGIPEVFQRNNLTGIKKRLTSGRAVARINGGDAPWQNLVEAEEGLNDVRIIENGIIKWRRRIGILNQGFEIALSPDKKSPLQGELRLKTCGNHAIGVSITNSEYKVVNNQDEAVVQLSARDHVPQSLAVNILPKSSKKEIVIFCPFPSSGALLYDPEGKSFNVSTPLFLYDLLGYRVQVFDEKYRPGKEALIRFSLMDSKISKDNLRDIYVEKKLKLSSSITEFRLTDWYSTIEGLLGVGGLDSFVQVSMSMDSQQKFKLSFYRYQNELEPIWAEGHVILPQETLKNLDVDVLNGVLLNAIKLNQPEQKSITLSPLLSQGVSIGKWDFAPSKKESGHWLIFPDVESSIKFRPLLWINNRDESKNDEIHVNVNSLQKASEIQDPELRENAIRSVLNGMAGDLEHKSWDYLKNLIDKTNHLPLPAFDVWRCSVSEPKFLAALFVKTGFEAVVARLEDELPIIWELVRISDWVSALGCLKNGFIRSITDEKGDVDESGLEAMSAILSRKIEAINELSTSMNCISKILRVVILGVEERELALMSYPASVVLDPQIKGEDGEQQRLLRRQADSEWPKVLNAQVKNIFNELPKSLQSLIPPSHDHQRSVFCLPLLLAWRINTNNEYGWIGSGVSVFKIQQLKQFDEDWFNTIFNFLSGWIYQHAEEFPEVIQHA